MKITIDVKRAEQSFDLTTMCQQNYLVVEFAGQEIKVPCDEAQLAEAIRVCMGHTQTVPPPEPQVAPPPPVPVTSSREFSYVPEEEDKPVEEAPAVFVIPELKPVPVACAVQRQPSAGTSLRPVARKPARPSDDAGISQG